MSLELSTVIELAVAATIAAVFVLAAAATLRDRHRQGDGWHVYVGAAIYGLIFGTIVGFVLVPIRISMLSGEVPTNMMGPMGAGVLFVVIALRRGWIGKLPFLGPQVRAYRRATLRRIIEVSQKQLDKLTPQTLEAAS